MTEASDTPGGALERITVNLTPRSGAALRRASARSGDSKTDTVNRAVQLYDYLDEVWASGGSVYIKHDPDDDLQILRIL